MAQLDPETRDRLRKPVKGSGLIDRKDRRKTIVTSERSEKLTVRRRDVRCRWPDCEYCRRYKPRLEVAHLNAKAIGGDHGIRSTADQMMLLCFLVHQGPRSLHSGDRKVETLTPLGTNGPCRYWLNDEQTGWRVVHTEDFNWRGVTLPAEDDEEVA